MEEKTVENLVEELLQLKIDDSQVFKASAIRVGNHCAQPLLASLNETSIGRLSFYLYNDESDIDKFCDSVIKTKDYF